MWRFGNGRAVLVAYELYRGPENHYGRTPGVLGRSEFGIAIVVAIAFLVHGVGLSLDTVCQVLAFFQHLALPTSQVDAVLRQLSRHWETDFEIPCTVLAHSAVVHADETRWSPDRVWAVSSEQARVILFGVYKDAGTLETVLDPETFAGLVIRDGAAVSAHFTRAQTCRAHLFRTATVSQPNGETGPVWGTNNEAGRTLRGSADARKTGRTSQTASGARRRTIVMSVLESLRLYLKVWALTHVIAEVKRWMELGRSCFEELLIRSQIPPPDNSILDRLFPKAEQATV